MKSIHLVLHMDINETCVIGDEAGGDTRDDCINKALAKSAFVQIPQSSNHVQGWDTTITTTMTTTTTGTSYEETSQLEPTHWWNGLPIQEVYSTDDVPPPLHTGWEWPMGCCPYYRTKYKNRAKTFLQHHGSIYKGLHDQMEAQLLLPQQQPGHEDSHPPLYDEIPILSHMIPALWETLAHLSAASSNAPKDEFGVCDGSENDENNASTGSRTEFTIVFRTMGTDLPDVARAITAFAQGRHPLYPAFTDPRLVLRPENLVNGRWAPSRLEGSDPTTGTMEYVYQLWKGESLVASGDREVLDYIHQHTVCGIQDDYKFWERHHHEPWAGKPVWIPLPPQDGYYYHHLLLDDNIHNLLHDSIASIRQEQEDGTFSTLTSREILDQHGLHLLRVPTIEPVLNPDWFLVQIANAQEKFMEHYIKNS